MLTPLAPFGNSKVSSNTNLSRLISLSFADANDKEISVGTNSSHPFMFIVPRDSQLLVPPMALQNVIAMNSTSYQLLFHLHYVNLSSVLPISVHLEMEPMNNSLAYLLVYRFDQIPQLTDSINAIDGWTVLCPASMRLMSCPSISSG